MNRAIVVAALCALGSGSALAQQNDEGFYIGGGVGQFNVQIDDYERIDSDVIDDADAIWLSGAWRF